MNGTARTAILMTMAVFVIVPLTLLIGWALSTTWDYPDLLPKNMQLSGLIDYLTQTNTVKAIKNSIKLSLIVTAGSLLLGYLPSKILGTRRFRGKTLLRIIVLLPALTPGICVVFGMIPVFIRLGIYREYISIVLAQITFTLPYMILTLSSVFENYDENYERQSFCLGVGKTVTFFHVIIPRIKSGLAVGCMYTFVVSWSMYLLTYELAPAGLETMTTTIMPMLVSSTVTYPILAATALVFFLPSLLFLFISTQIIKSDNISTGGGL